MKRWLSSRGALAYNPNWPNGQGKNILSSYPINSYRMCSMRIPLFFGTFWWYISDRLIGYWVCLLNFPFLGDRWQFPSLIALCSVYYGICVYWLIPLWCMLVHGLESSKRCGCLFKPKAFLSKFICDISYFSVFLLKGYCNWFKILILLL